ncbi:MAG: DUF559 domain-containing protein [Solirubrobacterales bacterium]
MIHQSPLLRTAIELANRQRGIVTRRQLLQRGLPARTIANAVERLNLFPVFDGVYLVGRPHLSQEALLRASLFAAGEGAVLARRTAASLWGILDHRNPIEVFRSGRGGVQRARLRVSGQSWWPRLVVSRSKALTPADGSSIRGLAVTSAERTLLDCAALLLEERFRWAFLEADRLDLLKDSKLSELARLTQGRKGGGQFRAMVLRRLPDIGQTRSLLEAIVLDLVHTGAIPQPEINRKTHAYRPDFRWVTRMVLVEADGYEFHRGREAFENDILRANRLRAEGWTVLRLTWRMVTERPDEVALMIRRAIRGDF